MKGFRACAWEQDLYDIMLLEVCVDSLESAIAAQAGGADRIELCSALSEGGITPSAGLIRSVRAAVSIGVHVMIRPRGGDFCFTPSEIKTMFADIKEAHLLGADGVVLGALTPDGEIDTKLCRELIATARPMKATFHRAFDQTRDLDRAFEEVIATGADILLTSGGERDIVRGAAQIARMMKAGRGRIAIMAGGGVRESNVHDFVVATGVEEVHSSIGVRMPGASRFHNPRVVLGARDEEQAQNVVREDDVRSLRQTLDAITATAAVEPKRAVVN